MINDIFYENFFHRIDSGELLPKEKKMKPKHGISCDRCFFSDGENCRVSPPDPMIKPPKIPSDKFPCGEFIDSDTGNSIQDIIEHILSKARQQAYRKPKTTA